MEVAQVGGLLTCWCMGGLFLLGVVMSNGPVTEIYEEFTVCYIPGASEVSI